MSHGHVNKFLSRLLISLVALLVVSCQEDNPSVIARHDREAPHKLEDILAENSESEQKQLIIEGINALRAGDYRKASRTFNKVLIDDPSNSGLHTLNGLTYQLMGKNGDAMGYDLAEAGYLQAKKFDPNNSFACLQLGRVKAEKKDYFGAQDEFSEVLLIDPTNFDALYELATVSYLAGDMKTARMSIDRLLRSDQGNPDYSRAGALIYAALGQHETANRYLASYKNSDASRRNKTYVERRVQEWHKLHASGHVTVAQQDSNGPNFDEVMPQGDLKLIAEEAVPPGQGTPPPPASTSTVPPGGTPPSGAGPTPPGAGSTPPGAGPTPPGPTGPPAPPAPGAGEKKDIKESVYEPLKEDMVVVDAVVLRVSEIGQTSKGNNILQNFNVTLAPYTKIRATSAGSGISTPNVFNAVNNINPGGGSVTGAAPFGPDLKAKVFTKGITLNNITYSLNIANVTRQYIEIIGRPTLTTSINKPASFFSGTDIKVALAGNFGGNVTQSPTGSTLKVTLLAVEGDYVTLDVELIGSILTETLPTIFGRASANTPLPFGVARSNVKTTVRVQLGETIMLGGTVERIDIDSDNGVPFLSNIPIIQYFFSQQTTDSERKSVMYLITPRGYKENLRETKNYYARGQEFNTRPSLTELENRYRDWFDPAANHIVILRDLGPIYRDFRTGDVMPVDWMTSQDIEQVLTQLVEFLWY